ncbi:MAG: ABC transporter substrate-binding protein, partial [Actinomycetota bacterium]|nr:ABC transporter substrate-binding protein [Actinomycetota bacterium]
MSVRPTRRLAVALTAAAALLLASCASSPNAEPAGSPTPSGPIEAAATAEPAASAFPVTVTSALGDAVIEAKPERVVTLGWGADDIAVSLGTIPVGVEIDTWAGDADGLRPWFREAVEAAGGEIPQAIAMYPELDVDAIVALEPDLVIAPQSSLDQAMFDQLSAFVPVVAHPGDAWATSVEDQVRLAAQALGVPERGDEILAERDAAIAKAKADHPELADVTFAYVYL